MGVNVTAMNYIGKYVQNAEEYLIEKGLLKKGQLAEEFDGDWGCADLGLDVQKVSYYSDAGYYIGFKVGLSDYVKFEKTER